MAAGFAMEDGGRMSTYGKISRQMLILIQALLLLTGCGGAQLEPAMTPVPIATTPTPIPLTPMPTATAALLPHVNGQTPTPIPPTPTPTPTAALLPRGNEQTPTPPEPSAGEVEIRIPFDIYAEGELPPTDAPECVNTIPFRMIRDGSRTMIAGEGQIDCHFVDTPQGSPITFHLILEFDGALNGELLPATSDKPSGWLDAYLALDGASTQYYVGYPPEATNPCPESNPCRIPSFEVIPVPLAYEDGSTVTTPWIFILHLW
jgi:hypothetical protein